MIYRSILLAFARLLKFFLFFPLSVAMFLRLILLSIIIFEINYKVSGSENNGQQLSCDIILFFYSNTKMRQQKRKKLCEKVASSELLKKLTDSCAREKC